MVVFLKGTALRARLEMVFYDPLPDDGDQGQVLAVSFDHPDLLVKYFFDGIISHGDCSTHEEAEEKLDALIKACPHSSENMPSAEHLKGFVIDLESSTT